MKVKCENWEELVVVVGLILRAHVRGPGLCSWSYYHPKGRLVYAGRVAAGIGDAELGLLWRPIGCEGERPEWDREILLPLAYLRSLIDYSRR